MINIRHRTFETNSSSCHSITVMSQKNWDKFMSREVLILRDRFNVSEHSEEFNCIDEWLEDEYFISTKEFYERAKDVLFVKDVRNTEYQRQNSEFYSHAYSVLLKKFDLDFMIKLMTFDKNEVVETLEKPIKCKSAFKDGYYTIKELKLDDLYDVFSDVVLLGPEVPDVYIFGDKTGWDSRKTSSTRVIKYTPDDGGEKVVYIDRHEEC